MQHNFGKIIIWIINAIYINLFKLYQFILFGYILGKIVFFICLSQSDFGVL